MKVIKIVCNVCENEEDVDNEKIIGLRVKDPENDDIYEEVNLDQTKIHVCTACFRELTAFWAERRKRLIKC
jgi:hypothetical protein